MTYFVDVFTVETWRAAEEREWRVTGFPPPTQGRGGYFQRTFDSVRVGDVLLCYVKAPAKRWVGALRVESPMRLDYDDAIWGRDESGRARFPARFEAIPIVTWPVERGIPVEETIGVLEALPEGAWSGIIRRSLNRVSDTDGEKLVEMLRTARESSPVRLPRRRVRASGSAAGVRRDARNGAEPRPTTAHTELVAKLIGLGRTLGCDVWVAPDERGRSYNGETFAELVLAEFPRIGLDPESREVVQNIDVLWVRGKSITAAFEVEATTSIFSGLLRMSDLVALQPNTNIDLFIVAPDERRRKVLAQIVRPTFDSFEPPLRERCRYLSATKLEECVSATKPPLNRYVRPEVIGEFAEIAADDAA